jgi:signal transduction histidine kinase
MLSILNFNVTMDQDVVMARRRARQLALLLGFDAQDATRIAAALSEIARNSRVYAGGCRVRFSVDQTPDPCLVIRVSDNGPGIANLDDVLDGKHQSPAGGAGGISAARRLVDGFEISSTSAGTVVALRKKLSNGARLPQDRALAAIADQLASDPQNLLEEIRQQNQELLDALEEVRSRKKELEQLNQELNETNRGVVALSGELEERAESLRRANELKSRFLSYASHEFRTPLNAIAGLSRLLLANSARGEEEIKQLHYIRRSAEDLRAIVDDLLDLAKAEAGKLTVHPATFEITNLFASLRGIFRPLQTNEAVELIFEPIALPLLESDEGKVSQILRNFISNGLKFTERGKVRVQARYLAGTDSIEFSVADTGCGIAASGLKQIFEEFNQIESPLTRKHTGTGLGLPLCKKLAELLGGKINVQSKEGRGSTFMVAIPRVHRLAVGEHQAGAKTRPRLLLVDDVEIDRYFVRQLLPDNWEIIESSNGQAALAAVGLHRPDLILLDLNMPGVNGFEVLDTLSRQSDTRNIPVVIVTSRKLDAAEKSTLERKAIRVLSKDELAQADKIDIHLGPPLSVAVQIAESKMEGHPSA